VRLKEYSGLAGEKFFFLYSTDRRTGADRPQTAEALRTPQVITRGHSYDGTPTGGAAATADSFKLMSMIETGWGHNRRPRTARHPVITEPTSSHADPTIEPQVSVEPTLAPVIRKDETDPNAAGISMGKIEELLRSLLEVERLKDCERERARSALSALSAR
jgi:hypothetical protein